MLIINIGKCFFCRCGVWATVNVGRQALCVSTSRSAGSSGRVIWWKLRWFFGRTATSANSPNFSEFCLMSVCCGTTHIDALRSEWGILFYFKYSYPFRTSMRRTINVFVFHSNFNVWRIREMNFRKNNLKTWNYHLRLITFPSHNNAALTR